MNKNLWIIDQEHSKINFSVKHLMISKVRGHFDRFSGTWLFDPEDLSSSKIEATIETGSVNTNDKTRDQYLKGPEFFNSEKYPTIYFRSIWIEIGENKQLRVAGELTLHGITRPVLFNVKGNVKEGTTIQTEIKRNDFKLNWSSLMESGGILVGDEVSVELNVQWIKQES